MPSSPASSARTTAWSAPWSRATAIDARCGSTTAAPAQRAAARAWRCRRTTLSLRPERVRLNPPEGLCDTVVPAVVKDLTYLGDHLRLRVLAFGDRELVTKLPNASSRRAVAAGDSIHIGWRADDCHALDVPA